MNKKILKGVIVIIILLAVTLGSLYLIDMSKMRKNEKVLFSTWGKTYIQPLEENEDNYQVNELLNAQEINSKDSSYFYGKVIESKQSYIIVKPNEGEEIRKSADKILVNLGEENDALYPINANVKITYKGAVMETYPAKVDIVNIELKLAENFEIRFYDKQPQSNDKINKILDKTETKQYNYSIYSYEGSVNILIGKEEMSLRNALLENKITMDEIIAKANQDIRDKEITGDTYKDGGSMIYQYKSYTMIKCHRLDGNRDVYIGVPDMTINDVI